MANPEPTQTESPETNGRRSRLESRRTRLERREQVIEEQRAARRRRAWLPWVIVAAVVLAIVAGLLAFFVIPAAQPIAGIERYDNLGRDHVTGDVAYPQVPPVGGPHAGSWYKCGVYEEPVNSPLAVHAMEHGAVWITYRPDLPADQVRRLRDFTRGSTYVLVSPWGTDPPLPAPVVVTAWGLQIQAQSANDSRVSEFVSRYANGPQTPEKGADCIRGVGQTMTSW